MTHSDSRNQIPRRSRAWTAHPMDLPTIRVGRCLLITEKALREWLERKTEATVGTQR